MIPRWAIANGEILYWVVASIVLWHRPRWVKSQSTCGAWAVTFVSRKSYVLIVSYSFWPSGKRSMQQNQHASAYIIGNPTMIMGDLIAEIIVGPTTSTAAFIVVNAKLSYFVLLRRDWLHSNFCVPSTFHQVLIFLVGDKVEVMSIDH